MAKRKASDPCWGEDDFDGWAAFCPIHHFRRGAESFHWQPDRPNGKAACGLTGIGRICSKGKWVRVKMVEVLPKKGKVIRGKK